MKTNIYLFGILLLALTTWSCEREYSAPPLSEPQYTGAEANITIAKLKSLYADIVDPTLIDVDYIIKAVVIGNDESGNIYKQLYIQDETGGINIGVDQNSIYTEFRVGQEVYVALKGLYMVMYGDQLQIGYAGTNANRISWELFNYHIFKDGWPDVNKAQPTVIQLSSLNESMVNTLVQLNDVYFTGGGVLTYSEPDATTNRTLKDSNGNTIIVRNSNYATFANDLLPEGAGTLIGILSKFRNDWQFYIRTLDDVQNFGQPIPETGEDPDTPPTGDAILNETFASGQGSFNVVDVTLPEGGTFVWKWDNYKYMKASAFVGGSAKQSESWLISPAMNLKDRSKATITFDHAINYAGTGTMSSQQELYISSDYSSGAPSSATWEKLTIPTYPAGNNWTFVSSGNIQVPASMLGKENVRIAFKYSSTSSNAATWEVKNVLVK
ncbi:MAG: Uncharacterized protein XD92_0101 [Proteiniphilum acetatigenes]|uniref:DUF5689 domain-containing protein n=1 Tax=Proteiniphilum acetatigenes TaxID=294710 RepID=A0A101HKW9_9BACT|nr:MAG: Uncharacterized protein XD92_0101 [Proteiniphilum acetatigenes]